MSPVEITLVVIIGIVAGAMWYLWKEERKEVIRLRADNKNLANQYTSLAARTSFIVDRWEASHKTVPTK